MNVVAPMGRAPSLEAVARNARNPTAALAYLRAAERVIQVDEVEGRVSAGRPGLLQRLLRRV